MTAEDEGVRRIHIEDLIGAPVDDHSGQRVGYVVDVAVRPKDGWEVVGLTLGRFSFLDRLDLLRAVLYRMGGPRPSRSVAWSDVESFDARRIRLRAGSRSTGTAKADPDGTSGERRRSTNAKGDGS